MREKKQAADVQRSSDPDAAALFTADVSPNVRGMRLEGESIDLAATGIGLERKSELLAKLKAGEQVGPLLVDAVTYIQRKTPNRNFARFAKGTLRSTAATFVGMPVLVNHGQRDVNARIGTIVSSRAHRTESGEIEFHQQLSIAKAWAIEGFLDGTLDRFSIGWHGGTVTCSIHKGPFFGKDACACWPGDEVGGKQAEAVWAGSSGIEVSAVNVPAVVGTGVEQIRAALSLAHGHDKPKRKTVMDEIRKQLGLPEDASEADVVAAIAANKAKLALAQEEAKRVAHEAAATAFQTQIDAAYADGRLAISRDSSGARVESDAEKQLKAWHAVDAKGAEAMLAAMTKRHPNGDGPQSQKPAPAGSEARPALAHPGADNPHLAGCAAQMGVTLEQVKQFGPHNRASLPNGVIVPPTLSRLFTTRHIGDEGAAK